MSVINLSIYFVNLKEKEREYNLRTFMSILSYIPSLNYFNFIFDFPLVVVTTQLRYVLYFFLFIFYEFICFFSRYEMSIYPM